MDEVVPVSIEAVRDRFHSLGVAMAYFDGPGGTQCPDSVIEAVSGYLLTANANVGGKFLTSLVTDDVVHSARAAASDLLGVPTDEVIFGQNMTTLNFALTRTAARDWREGDEVIVTRLDHDGNVAPWLQVAEDKGLVVKRANLDHECRVDLDHLRSLVSDRTKVIAFPVGLERRRHDHAGQRDRRDRARRGCTRVGGCRALRAARRHRGRRCGRRRASLLGLQVLRAARRPRVGAARSAHRLAPIQGATVE